MSKFSVLQSFKLLNKSFHTKKMKCFLVFFFCFINAFFSDSVLILLEFISGCGVRYGSLSIFSKRVINFSNRVNYIPLISISYLSGIIKYSWYKELRQVWISYKPGTSLDSSGTTIGNHHPPHCWNVDTNLLAHLPKFDDFFVLMKNNNALTTELASVLLN